MKKRTFLEAAAFLAGVALFIGVMRHFGVEAIARMLSKAGPASLLVFLLYPLMSVWDVMSWRFCLGSQWGWKARFPQLFFIRLAGEALNNMTPFLDIGGEPLKAHLANRWLGIPMANAASSTVVARTSLLLSEVLFMMMGLVLSFPLMPLEPDQRWQMTLALVVVCVVLLIVIALQQREWMRKLNPEIPKLYATERPSFAAAVFLNWLGWMSGAVEMWIFCRILGTPVTLAEAVMLESMLQLVRLATFFIPGNLGAQEGGLAFFMGALGFDPLAGVGLSLLKRCRQLIWTGIGFLVWAGYQYQDAKAREVTLEGKAILSFDTWVDSRIHRPPAELLARALCWTPVTPNQVTLFSLVPAVLCGAFLALGGPLPATLGLFFFYIWSVMDHADGSLARKKQLFSRYGQFLDDLCDQIATAAIFLGIFIGLIGHWNAGDRAVIEKLFYLAMSLNVLTQYFVTAARRRTRRIAAENKKARESFLWRQRLLDSLAGRDAVYVLLFLTMAAHAWGDIFWHLRSLVVGLLTTGMFVMAGVSLSEYLRKDVEAFS